VSPVRYEMGFYIPEDDILHSHSVKTSNLTYPAELCIGDVMCLL
jgi:hypothetical protein